MSDMITTEVSHPSHTVPDEIAQGLRHLAEQEDHAATQRSELARLARPTSEERQARSTLYETVGKALGVDVDEHRTHTEARNAAVINRLEGIDLQGPKPWVEFVPIDFEPPPPQRSDPSFWAARPELFTTPPFTAEALASTSRASARPTAARCSS